jgi:urease accessory protein UreF
LNKPRIQSNEPENKTMKATNIGRLAVGCVLACSFTSNLHAQSTATNTPNTALTAAQRAAAEAAQLQTLMQATAQALAQSQAAHPARLKSAGQSAGQQSLIVGGQPDEFLEDYAPWIVQDIPMLDGSQLTADALV